jgi:hypothetical protein
MKACQWCLEVFKAKVDYQIYCSANCREAATREKVRDRARIASIRRRYKKNRMCANNCGTKLNAYNDSKICARCVVNDKLVEKALDNITDFFSIEDLT